MSVPPAIIERMFESLDDGGVVASMGVASREENAACARRLEAMGELYARRAPEDDVERMDWAIDGHENIVDPDQTPAPGTA